MSSFRVCGGRVAVAPRQSLTRFEGMKKPLFVSQERPFELPYRKTQREASALALPLQFVVLLKFSNVSLGDCFAALQIAVGGFLPALSF